MKKIKKIIWTGILLIVAILTAYIPEPVYAADIYTITINDSALVLNQVFFLDYRYLGAGDMFEQIVDVQNVTDSTYVIYLKDVEILEDSILLNMLTFSITGNNVKTVTVDKSRFDDVLRTEFLTIPAKTDDSFRLSTIAGNLSNEYQGLACSIRCTFEITKREATGSPDNKVKNSILNSIYTGDGSHLALMVFICTLSLSLIILMTIKKGKTHEEEYVKDTKKASCFRS
ncbi:MAG: hypothetical protein FWG21_03815 [Oscillospiraceae bacterium]|nr:hypothetical protein [Oscillospiraceae bacterium]